MKLVKGDGDFSVLDGQDNTVIFGVIELVKDAIDDMVRFERAAKRSKLISAGFYHLHIFGDGAGSFGNITEMIFELFEVSFGGAGVGCSKGFPCFESSGQREMRGTRGAESVPDKALRMSLSWQNQVVYAGLEIIVVVDFCGSELSSVTGAFMVVVSS